MKTFAVLKVNAGTQLNETKKEAEKEQNQFNSWNNEMKMKEIWGLIKKRNNSCLKSVK